MGMSARALRNLSQALAPKGLSVKVTALEAMGEQAATGKNVRLAIVGPDRPGIVRQQLTEARARQEQLVTESKLPPAASG